MKPPLLSVVVPVYNEEAIIEKNLKKIVIYLGTKKYPSEIVVVDDGSQDSTVRRIEKAMRVLKGNIKLLKHNENMGKGAAVRTGILGALGGRIIFMDADLSVPLGYIDNLVDVLEDNDVAIGSRRVKGSVIKKHQPFVRETMGRVFTKLTQVAMGSSVSDFTCGFKGFTRKAAKEIFSRSKIDRWAYDAEIIFLANMLGYSIVQVPVIWANREETRVRVGKAAFEALVDLVRIHVNRLKGEYA